MNTICFSYVAEQSVMIKDINCSDIISTCQKMSSKVFPIVLQILTNFVFLTKSEKFQSRIIERCLMMKKIEAVFKIEKKNTFFSKPFKVLKKA